MTTPVKLTPFSRNLMLAVALVVIVTSGFVLYLRAENQLQYAYQQRELSVRYADELRQSSDDLTRMVRTYVVTGEPIYKTRYQRILDIRNGEKPRPEAYWRSYWDLVLVDGQAPRADSAQQIALLSLMRQAGFTEQEFQKLADAEAHLTALTATEFIAMSLAEVRGTDAEAAHAKARRMVFDGQYHQAKAGIMKPIDEFYVLMDERTRAAIQFAEQNAAAIRLIFVATALGLFFVLWRSYIALRNTLGGSVDEVYAQIVKIGGGDLSVSVSPRYGGESSVLSWLAEMRSRLSDIERRRFLLEERLSVVVESAPNALLMVDRNGCITLANAQAGRLFGYSREEMHGQRVELLVPERFRSAHPQQRDRFFAAPVTRAMGAGRDLFGLCNGGREVPVEIGLSPVATSEGEFVLASVIDITERKNTQAKLLRLQREHERILNTVDFGIHGIDLQGNIFFENLGAAAMFGRDAQEMIGQPAHALMHHTRVDGAPYPLSECHIYATLRDGVLRRVEDEVFWRKDGTNFPVSYTSTPLYDDTGAIAGVLVAFRDITTRKQIEAALHRAQSELEDRVRERTDELRTANLALHDSDQRMRLATEATGVGIWEWNVISNKITWDAQMFRMYGIAPTPDGIIAYSDWSGSVVPEELQQQEEILQDTVRRLGRSHRVFRISRRNDAQVRVIEAVEAVRSNAQGQAEWVVGTNLDITERRWAETALQQAHDELETKVMERTAELARAKERAESADRIKSAFLATMSHELRTPLNSIIGFTGILLQGLAGALNPEQGKQLDMVRGSARHLLALINDVLDISKIEAGQLEVTREWFELAPSIQKVIDVIKPLAENKMLALRVTVAPGLGHAVSDQRRFEQILLNLLSNAVKFTEHGEITLVAESVVDYKSPLGSAPGPAIRLCITDTGIGIAPEDLATLFQPFRQLDSGLARNHEGTGLGLAICRRLADLMGGDIHAASTPGKGSMFSFTLPLEAPAP